MRNDLNIIPRGDERADSHDVIGVEMCIDGHDDWFVRYFAKFFQYFLRGSLAFCHINDNDTIGPFDENRIG